MNHPPTIGEVVVLTKPVQIRARVIGQVSEGSFYLVQLLPLRQSYMPEDMQTWNAPDLEILTWASEAWKKELTHNNDLGHRLLENPQNAELAREFAESSVKLGLWIEK